MNQRPAPPTDTRPVADVVATALGRVHRSDPVRPRTGGPAGNARLTSWTGLALLVLFVVECATLISLGALIDVHIVVGTALTALVLLKTGATGWRILRYYTGHPAYRQAGPPPVILRLAGPLVVLGGLAVVGSGLALIPLGSATYRPLATIAGQRIDALTVHQACFAFWLVLVGLHAVARSLPAVNVVAARKTPAAVAGRAVRSGLLAGTLAGGVIAGVLLLQSSSAWTSGHLGHHGRGRRGTAAIRPARASP